MAPPFSLFSISLLALIQQCSSAKIEWGPCKDGEFNSTLVIQCGNLRVPLDYTDHGSNKSLDLELVKVLAPVQPARGSIQLNFGGPGAPTRAAAVSAGPVLQLLSGGVYDLIGLDPRGTGKTIPFVCTDDAFTIGQILSEGRSSLESDTAERRVWERSRVDANICQQSSQGNETGQFFGTAFVARDVMSVAEALGEDGTLRYWGFSYGTTLGATLAAMFPDKVDKILIDGVQNPHEYYHAHADYEEWTDSDAIFSYFFSSCLTAKPGRCALAGLNKTASELERDAWTFIDSLRTAPVAAGNALIDMMTFKSFVIGQLKFTGGWPAMSTIFATLLYGSQADKVRVLEAIVEEATANQETGITSFEIVSSLWAIHCSDRTVRLDSFQSQKAAGVFERLYKTSRLVGDVVAQITAHCAQWPWHARETYAGDFRVKTRSPILVASNTRDSHTPLRSALNVSAGFEGSGLLEVNATGHATLNAPSVCGYLATVAYWINGSLPKPGSVCQAPHPYDDYTWANVLQQVTGQNTTSAEKRALNRRWC